MHDLFNGRIVSVERIDPNEEGLLSPLVGRIPLVRMIGFAGLRYRLALE